MNEPFHSPEQLLTAHVAWIAAQLHDEPLAEISRTLLARVQATRMAAIELPMLVLESRLALSETEMRVLWLLLAHELDPSVRGAVRAAASEQLADVTLDVIRRIVYGHASRARVWHELGPEGRLRTWGLIERTDGSVPAPEYRQTFKVAARVLALAYGDLALDPEVASYARIVSAGTALDALEIDPRVVDSARRAVEQAGIVIAYGRIGSGRRSLLASVIDRPTIVVEGGALATERMLARAQLATIGREARLLGAVPLIRAIDALGDRIDLVETGLEGLVLATSTSRVARRWGRACVQLALPPLDGAACGRVWKRAIPQASETDVDYLATMYPLSPALICAAGTAAQAVCGHAKMQPEHIESAVRNVLDHALAGLATRVTVTQTWDDLVIPEDQFASLIELIARIRDRRRVYEEWGYAEKLGRGLGVAALFSGPPGTGKTMAAGLIARELRCEIYQVDVSKVVSKWIGETEKNLAALFDAAEAGHAILLFDEADTLFGKRTDVKSSNDRHANQEVNFLLQRIESYQGMCILTTNHESAMDEAFRRRLAVHVRFPMPELEERKHLWRALVPPRAPTQGDLRLHELAERFVMSGGHIRNAALRAAFLAASENTAITQETLARAARLEYEAMGKIAPPAPLQKLSSLYG